MPAATVHRTGQSHLARLTPGMVAEAPDPAWAFARYCQQQIGFPWLTVEDERMLRKRIKDLFIECPQANYYTLCRVVAWAKAHRIRRTHVWQLINLIRAAWADGMLPELNDPDHDPELDANIFAAIAVESDPAWRRRLRDTVGVGMRRAAYHSWLDAHA